MKKTVIILGGGIGGLTCAMELAQRGYDVTIIEREPAVGGLARSSGGTSIVNPGDNSDCPSEYSWRIFIDDYYNALDVVRRIPTVGKRTVADNLIPINLFDGSEGVKTSCKKSSMKWVPEKVSWRDKLFALNIAARNYTSSETRNIDETSGVNWSDTLAAHGISPPGYNQYVRSLGPILGYDNQRASVYDVCKFLEFGTNTLLLSYVGLSSTIFKVFNAPTSVAWFQHWARLLKFHGVKILTDTFVDSVNIENGRVLSVDIRGPGGSNRITADHYVCALGLDAAAKLIPQIPDITTLAKNGRQIQLSIQMYFDRKLHTYDKIDYLYLSKSPWAIIILGQGRSWEGTFDLTKHCSENVKDIWSVAICETSTPGNKIKKPFIHCTKEEVMEEAWHQIITEPGIDDVICVESGEIFSSIKPIDVKIWPSFQYSNGTMDTYEPKFGNNVNTYKYRPGTTVPGLTNLYISTAWSRTTRCIHSMEGATEAGKRAAAAIIGPKSDVVVYDHIRVGGPLLAPLHAVDYALYSAGIGHLSGLFLGSSLLLLMVYIIILAMLVYIGSKKVYSAVTEKIPAE